MIVDDSEVAVKKFKMFAEKVDSEAKVVELCKKYLKHKGIDIDALNNTVSKVLLEQQTAPAKVETVYVNPNDLHILKYGSTIDNGQLDRLDPAMKQQMIADTKRRMVDNMIYELVQKDLVKFESYQDYACDQMRIYGYLKVWKGR